MTKPPSPRPLSVKVISIIYLVTGPFYIWCSLSIIPVLKEWTDLFLSPHQRIALSSLYGLISCVYILFALGVLGPILGIGLWRLKETARRVAIGYQVLWMLNYVIASCSFLAVNSAILLVLRSGRPSWTRDIVAWLFCLAVWVTPLLFNLRILQFLIKHKSAFGNSRTPSPLQ